MRITEGQLIRSAAQMTARARERVARPQRELASGTRVARPSDDVGAWVEGQRARLREVDNRGHGDVIARSRERLSEVDQIFGAVGGLLQRARELAVEGANDTYSAGNRAQMAVEVRMLRAEILRQINARASDGEPLLAGTSASDPPFDAAGAYTGNASEREVELLGGLRYTVGVAGTALTAAAGVDVVKTLDDLAGAFDADSSSAIRGAMGGVIAAHDQVQAARAGVGTRLRALDVAADAREQLSLELAAIRSRTLDADVVGAASELANAMTGLEAARAVAERVISLVRG